MYITGLFSIYYNSKSVCVPCFVWYSLPCNALRVLQGPNKAHLNDLMYSSYIMFFQLQYVQVLSRSVERTWTHSLKPLTLCFTRRVLGLC